MYYNTCGNWTKIPVYVFTSSDDDLLCVLCTSLVTKWIKTARQDTAVHWNIPKLPWYWGVHIIITLGLGGMSLEKCLSCKGSLYPEKFSSPWHSNSLFTFRVHTEKWRQILTVCFAGERNPFTKWSVTTNVCECRESTLKASVWSHERGSHKYAMSNYTNTLNFKT